jgi:hypothetical protein
MLTCPLLLLVIWVGLTTDPEPTVRADETVPHWSFQKPVRPTVPAKKQLPHGERVQNPVDAFVLARLEQEGLAPAPLVDPWILVRRAYFDPLGLDQRQLAYLFEGRQCRLTDVGGNNDLSSRLTG